MSVLTSQIVDEILALLGEARAVAPQGDDVQGTVDAEPASRPDALAKLKASYDKRLAGDPPGATPGQLKRLEIPRLRFANAHGTAGREPTDDQVEHVKSVYAEVLAAYTEIVEEVSAKADLLRRLTATAPAGVSGTALVAGAADADTKTLESLRDTAAKAVNDATTVSEYAAAEAPLSAVLAERQKVEVLVEARAKRAEKLGLDEAALVTPPEAPAGSLVTERNAVTNPLAATPLTDPALTTSDLALAQLKVAWAAAEKEALALRQMRALFKKELDTLRKQIDDVAGNLSGKQNSQRVTVEEIRAALATAELKLAVTEARAETEKFPAALATARQRFLAEVVSGLVGTPNEAGKAGAAYLKVELSRLEAEADELPNLNATSQGYASTAKTQIKTALLKLGKGTGGQASQAKSFIEALDKTIRDWRAYVGPVGIVLGRRKTEVKDKIKLANPDGTSPAFVLALKGIRDAVEVSLLKPLSDANVVEAETLLVPFEPTRKKADVDAKAAARVTAARVTLDKDLAGIIAATRASARVELEKSRDTAYARASLTEVDRDMPRTAVLHKALVARMLEVKAEGTYAAADKTPLAEFDDAVKELAFDLCGPAVVGSLSARAKTDLSAVLLSDGPAIKQLAESAFAGNTKAFAKVLNDCGSDGVVALARALNGGPAAAARAALDGLVQSGGLGANPAVLAQLVGEGPGAADTPTVAQAKRDRQVANAGRIKSVALSFAGEDGQASMSTLLNDCALAASPGALASLVHDDGFDGDGDKVREFADAFVGDTPDAEEERAGFARLVNTGGVAQHPKVLGPLAKQGGADGVKEIGAAFVDPADCANLKGLLDAGGMGGDTGVPGREHEHPDTLSKVFVDGLEGKGENLKTYATAFQGVAGRAKSKEMLDAFNEFGDTYKDQRQPGEGIAGLLDDDHLQGTTEQKIGKLSTQFVPQIRNIAAGGQRKQAIRMAPHFGKETAQEGWKPKSVAMDAEGINSVTSSVLKRHKPEAFDRNKMKANVPRQSMFAPGTDVGDLLDQAMALIGPGRGAAQQVVVNSGPPPTPITVEIGFLGGDTVNHFGPRGNAGPPHPQETPAFTNAEINFIYAAAK